MSAVHPIPVLKLIAAAIIGLAMTSPAAHAQKVRSEKLSEIRVFVRASRTLAGLLLDDQIKLDSRIDRQARSFQIRGEITGSAGVQIELKPGRGQVGVVAIVNGDLTADLTAENSIASANGRYSSKFKSNMKFTFDGRDFGHRPAKTVASGSIRVRQICSRHKGVLGRLVRKVTGRVIQKNEDNINQLLSQSVQKSVSQQIDDIGDSFVKELNQLDRYAEMMEKYFPAAQDGQIQILTTSSHLLAGFGQETDDFPSIAKQSIDDPEPEIEVWIRARPIEKTFIKLLEDWEITHDLLKSYLPEEQARKVADNLRVESREGWTVLRIGIEQNSN